MRLSTLAEPGYPIGRLIESAAGLAADGRSRTQRSLDGALPVLAALGQREEPARQVGVVEDARPCTEDGGSDRQDHLVDAVGGEGLPGDVPSAADPGPGVPGGGDAVEDLPQVALGTSHRGAVGVGRRRARRELIVVGDEPDRKAAVRQVVALSVEPPQRPAPDHDGVDTGDEVLEVALLAIAGDGLEERHVVAGTGDPPVDRHRRVPDDLHAYDVRACSIAARRLSAG